MLNDSFSVDDFKVIYTDNEHVAVTYSCAGRNEDGTCKHDLQQVRINPLFIHIDNSYLTRSLWSPCLTINSC